MAEPSSQIEEPISALEREARKHVKKQQEFYVHLAVYIVTNVTLAAINLLTTPTYFWAAFAMLGWGIGLAAHAVDVFGLFGIGGKRWEERKVREYMSVRGAGLDRMEVRDLLRQELGKRRLGAGDPDELARLRQRVEQLETIVTSVDWQVLEQTGRPRLDEPDPEADDEPGEDAPSRAARLAKRVR